MTTSDVLKSWRSLRVVLLIAFYVAGCKTKDPQPTADQYLVSSSNVATPTKEQLVAQATRLCAPSAPRHIGG